MYLFYLKMEKRLNILKIQPYEISFLNDYNPNKKKYD